jgi:hypothetical protein
LFETGRIRIENLTYPSLIEKGGEEIAGAGGSATTCRDESRINEIVEKNCLKKNIFEQ